MKGIKIALIILLVLSIGFLSACKKAEQNDSQAAANADSGSSVTEKLSDILTKRTVEYKARYKIEATYGDTAGSEMVWAVKGDKFKMDILNKDAQVSSSIYQLGSDTYICTVIPSKGPQCVKMASQKSNMNVEESLKEIGNELKYTSTLSAPRVIAGATAVCFTVAPKAQAGFVSAESCVSKEGVPLYMKTVSDAGTSVMEAVEYSTSVPDSEFTVPAPAEDMTQLIKSAQQMQG